MAQELTGQEVVSQITSRLRARFNTTQFVEIYKDKPVQNMKKPCIFVESVNTVHVPQLRRYSQWNYTLDIRCHPAERQTNIQTWGRGVAVLVIEAVSRLEVSGQQVKMTGANWRIVDDVLHVIVDYSFRVVQTAEKAPDMETLTYGERIK